MVLFVMQRDHSKKRTENHHFESNGTSGKSHFLSGICFSWFRKYLAFCFLYQVFKTFSSVGLYGQHSAKKPKISKQSLENTFDNITSMTGSIPSPVASQNNMSNTSKFIKLIGGRDRGRKAKLLKVLLHRFHYFTVL